LNIASVQNRTRTSNNSVGASAGISGSTGLDNPATTENESGDSNINGANGGANTANGTSRSKETLLTSITGSTVNINTTGNTDIKGALVAAGEVNEEGNFVDNGQLDLKTGSLTHSDLSNTSYSSQTSASLNTNVSINNQPANPQDPTSKDQTDLNINSSQITAHNTQTTTKTKTLATLGEGTVTVGGTEVQTDSTLNRNVDNLDKEIYSVEQTQGNVDLTIDHRLLSEDGRNDIAEDAERTVRLGEAIVDVATKESFEAGDTLDHIDEVQKDLDVQKAFALEGDGAFIEVLEGKDSTPEQKQEAITRYAEIYAETYGISIEEANVIATNKYIKGATHNENQTNNNIYINDEAQRNATDYANTMGHEVTHARVNQGTTRNRADGVDAAIGKRLNEEYANTMGGYSADGMEFSNNTYTRNAPIDKHTSTNTHKGNADSEAIKSNTDGFVNVATNNPNQMDYAGVSLEQYNQLKDAAKNGDKSSELLLLLGEPKEQQDTQKINTLLASMDQEDIETTKEIAKDYDIQAEVENDINNAIVTTAKDPETYKELSGYNDAVSTVNAILDGDYIEAGLLAAGILLKPVKGLKNVDEILDLIEKNGGKAITKDGKIFGKNKNGELVEADAKDLEDRVKNIKNKDEWDDKQLSQAERKKAKLLKEIQEGKASPNSKHGVTDLERSKITNKYRKDLKKKIESLYKDNPTAKQNALDKLERSDIDHKLDLQLSGSNTRANVNTLDSSVNRSYGKQLDNILKDLGIE